MQGVAKPSRDRNTLRYAFEISKKKCRQKECAMFASCAVSLNFITSILCIFSLYLDGVATRWRLGRRRAPFGVGVGAQGTSVLREILCMQKCNWVGVRGSVCVLGSRLIDAVEN